MGDATIEEVERIRAALSEIGYTDPDIVIRDPRPDFHISWRMDVPMEIMWRAREAAHFGETTCHACWRRTFGEPADGTHRCLASRRLTEDCGLAAAAPDTGDQQ